MKPVVPEILKEKVESLLDLKPKVSMACFIETKARVSGEIIEFDEGQIEAHINFKPASGTAIDATSEIFLDGINYSFLIKSDYRRGVLESTGHLRERFDLQSPPHTYLSRLKEAV